MIIFTPDHSNWAIPDFFLGKIYSQKGEVKKALYYHRNAVHISAQFYQTKNLCESYLALAQTFEKLGNTDSSLYYAEQSLLLANELSLPAQSLDASTFLSSVYESKHLTDSAFKYQKISITLKDSLLSKEKIKQIQNYTFNEQLRQQEIQKAHEEYQVKIKTYSLLAALVVFLIIALILWRNNKQKQKANRLLQQQKEKVDSTLQELKSTQAQLIQSEKMASLGELTAGIAHEIQNPLNFVNNFSEVNTELIDEMQQALQAGDTEEAFSISNDLKDNEQKIIHHGKRADSIVKGMLQHSRVSSGHKELTDINALADEYLRLSYHGMRAKDKTFNTTLQTNFDTGIGKINVVPQDMGRVRLNLFNNSFYSVIQKKKEANAPYEPTVSVCTKKVDSNIEIHVKDNGNGIPRNIVDKVFQPFFTTKPTGQGTGLGLSLSYDIIKAHGGDIKVETKEGDGAELIIQVPLV